MCYELQPYIGIGDFAFGRTQAQIKKEFGTPPLIEIDNIMKEIREQRLGMTFRYIKKNW